MLSQGCITHGVAPINQPLLAVTVHLLKTGWDLSEILGIAFRAAQGIGIKPIILIVGPDPPIGARVVSIEGIDQVPGT